MKFTKYEPDALSRICTKFKCPGCYNYDGLAPCSTKEFIDDLKKEKERNTKI